MKGILIAVIVNMLSLWKGIEHYVLTIAPLSLIPLRNFRF